MTPAARVQAAIDILDRLGPDWLAERALTAWARGSRFAGARDRLAVRDHVFDVLRCKRSFAALGGGKSGRALMIGALRASGIAPEALFTGEGYGPATLSEAEQEAPPGAMDEAVALDCPDWLVPRLRESLGSDFAPVMECLRHRAPVHLRVNIQRTTPARAMAVLAEDGIVARPAPLAAAALEVVENARRIHLSRAYGEGLVELQDAASQAVIEALPLSAGMQALDYCAGGGGKSLALAARGARVLAHDAAPARMSDLPARAARAGADVRVVSTQVAEEMLHDLVLLDVPCSGSGSWRRAPEGKWLLDETRLDALCSTQSAILDRAQALVAPSGWLAYVTCSLIDWENAMQIAAFRARWPEWRRVSERRLTPLDGADGFYMALLSRAG